MERLCCNVEMLVSDLDIDTLLPYLVESHVISLPQNEIIRSKVAPSLMVVELLRYLVREEASIYDKLCEELIRSNKEYIIDGLNQSDRRHNPGLSYAACLEKNVEVMNLENIPVGSSELFLNQPETVSYYFERKELEEQLLEHLRQNPCLVLSGMHGCGKTQLAHKLSKIIKKNGFSYEVSCDTLDDMYSRLMILAKNLELKPQTNKYRADGNTESKSSKSRELLSSTQYLLMQILQHFSKFSHSVVVLCFDNVTKESRKVFTSDVLQTAQQTKIIMTTNDESLEMKYGVPVNGFKESEAISFFRKDYDCSDEDEDIKELGKQLSYLPLGLKVAKTFMQRRNQMIKEYLKLLNSRRTGKKMVKSEKDYLEEGEYDTGLISAIHMSLDDLRDSLDEEATYKAFELLALLSPQNIPFDFISPALEGELEEKMFVKGELLELVKQHSLFSAVQKINGRTMVNIHEAVQLAIRIKWTEKEFKDTMEVCLWACAGIVDKDNRKTKAFQYLWGLIPHMQRILLHLSQMKPSQSKKANIAEIKVLDFVSHMMLEFSVSEAEELLQKSKEKIYEYFIGMSEDDVEKKVKLQNSNQCDTKLKASFIFEILKINQPNAELIMDFVLGKSFYETSYFEIWDKRIKLDDDEKDILQLGCISQELYQKLTDKKVALPLNVLQIVFLPELFLISLYTHGRVYFHQPAEFKSDVCYEDLKLAFEIAVLVCDEIKKEFGFDCKILHWMLLQAFGLNSYYLDSYRRDRSSEQMLSDVLKAKKNYQDLEALEVDYYENGFFKETTINKMLYTRQLNTCYIYLLQNETDQIKLQAYKKEAESFLQEVEKHMENNKESYTTLANVSTFYIKLSHLRFLTGGEKNVDEAIRCLSECCEREKTSNMVRLPWLDALRTLTEACVLKSSATELYACKEKLQQYLAALEKSKEIKETGYQQSQVNSLMKAVESALEKVPS